MKFHIIVTTRAVADIELARAFLDEWSSGDPERWYETLRETLASLADMPKRYPVAPESDAVGRIIRHVRVGKFRVLYSVDPDAVRIWQIRHVAASPLTPKEGL